MRYFKYRYIFFSGKKNGANLEGLRRKITGNQGDD